MHMQKLFTEGLIFFFFFPQMLLLPQPKDSWFETTPIPKRIKVGTPLF